MKVDINDTLNADGLPAVRSRHDQAAGLRILPSPKAPMEVARIFLGQHHQHKQLLTLRHWRGGWWHWRRSFWSEIDDRLVRSWLYDFTADAVYIDKLNLAEWRPRALLLVMRRSMNCATLPRPSALS
jgi:hypothetical protein